MNSTTLSDILVELFAESLLLLTLAWLLSTALPRLSAARRHVLWLAVFIALALLPGTRLLKSHWAVPMDTLTVHWPGEIGKPPALAPVHSSTPVDVPPLVQFSGTRLAIGGWLTVAAVLMLYRLLGHLKLMRMSWRSCACEDEGIALLAPGAAKACGLDRAFALRLSGEVPVPMTWGYWRPVVMLPFCASEWSESELMAVLRHELAHVARRDALSRWLAEVVCSVYWMNPLVWLAARRMRLAQEESCDDSVLRSGVGAVEYANLLCQVAQKWRGAFLFEEEGIAMARPTFLEHRVRAILDERRDRRTAGGPIRAFGVTLVLFILLVNAYTRVAEQNPQAPIAQSGAKNEMITVSMRLIELPSGALSLPEHGRNEGVVIGDGDLADRLRVLEERGLVKLVTAPSLSVRPGQHGSVSVEQGYISLADGTKKALGLSCSCEANKVSGKTTLKAQFSLCELKNDSLPKGAAPEFLEAAAEASSVLSEGQTVALGPWPARIAGQEILLLLEPIINDSMVDISAKEINSELGQEQFSGDARVTFPSTSYIGESLTIQARGGTYDSYTHTAYFNGNTAITLPGGKTVRGENLTVRIK